MAIAKGHAYCGLGKDGIHSVPSMALKRAKDGQIHGPSLEKNVLKRYWTDIYMDAVFVVHQQ